MKRNTIIEKIIDEELVREGSYIIVGFSGGPDSLCLLHALSELSDSMDLSLVPVHVNHRLRPEADEEADNAEYICDRMGLDCVIFEADCQTLAEEMKISTEEAGRIIRYEIFDEVASQLVSEGVPRDLVYIAVAHNADDQSETVLFRLLRGTGVHGLAGVPAERLSEAGFMIIRPLLRIERSEIEKYIAENRLHPNIDRSNYSNTYARNRIRNELIPYLEENYNPNIRNVLRRYAELAAMDDSVLTDLTFLSLRDSLVIDAENAVMTLDITDLRNDPIPIVSRAISTMLTSLRLEKNISYELIVMLTGLVYTDNPSASLDLPEGLRAYRDYDKLIIANADGETALQPDDSISIYPRIIMMKDFHPDADAVYAAFDFDKFNEEHPGQAGDIVLRTRQEGDYLPIRGGRKKIQDLLVDAKVSKNARGSILMAAIGSEVLWILPNESFHRPQDTQKGRFSHKYHITDKTERVLFIEITNDI